MGVACLAFLMEHFDMPKLPEKQVSNFEQPPVGNHLAVCYAVIDLGTQTVDYKQGKGPEEHHQIAILWELPNELNEEKKPHMTSKTYNFSSNEKSNMMKDLQSWRGREFTEDEYSHFEIGDVIGAGCFLNCVEHGEYVNADNIAALPKGTKVPALVNQKCLIDIDETFNKESYELLSDFWKLKILSSPEYAALIEAPDSADGETPF